MTQRVAPSSDPTTELRWRRRRGRRALAVLALFTLGLANVLVVIVSPGSQLGAAMRRTVGLNVAQGGSFDIASEAYAIVEDGAIFHRPLDDDAVEVHREEVAQETGGAPLVVLGRAEGRKARTGWWAITREECRYDFVVLSMDPADVDSARANNIVEAAQPALLESIARVAPAWWARFGEAADLDPPIVRRVLWLGVAQNVLGVITLVALPPTFVAWRRARSVHRRIHSVVVRRRCPHCGYELEDGIGPRCPECGAELR